MSGTDTFKFGFFESANDKDKNTSERSKTFKEAVEIIVTEKDLMPVDSVPVEVVRLPDGSELRHVTCEYVEGGISAGSQSAVCEAARQSSDLVPNVYEGGLKIWECSIDLVEYLCENKIDFEGKAVLELGCGAGLPGLYAMKQGARVTFQDYNQEVVRHMTTVNVSLNGCDEGGPGGEGGVGAGVERCRFYAGDWGTLVTLLTEKQIEKYDVIVTAETIYSLDSYPDVHRALSVLLKPGGYVYLAAKVCYFGVGGGIRQFEEFIKAQGVLNSRVVKCIDTGVKREILEITFKDKDKE